MVAKNHLPQAMSRFKYAISFRATDTRFEFKATLRIAFQSLVSAGRVPASIEARLSAMIRAGRIEAAVRLLVQNNRRAEARKLAKALQD